MRRASTPALCHCQVLSPGAAALGVLLARGAERRLAIVLAITGLLLIWVAKGVHPPLVNTNRWAYEHVPGFWLLREPAKVLLLLALIAAILGGIGVARLVQGTRGPRPLSRSVAVIWIAGCIAFVHPLFTGEVISIHPGYLPPAQAKMNTAAGTSRCGSPRRRRWCSPSATRARPTAVTCSRTSQARRASARRATSCADKLGAKIRMARTSLRSPYMLVVGPKDAEAGSGLGPLA